MTKFYLSSNPDNLAAKLALFARTGTVEAEFGDRLVSGSVITMAHHGPRAGQPAPCSYDNTCVDGYLDAVGLSHFDLDTLGGCMAIAGSKPKAPGFWELAEFVDLNGSHKLAKSGATEENIRRLYAFWAWSEKNKLFPPRDGSVADVTDFIAHAITVIHEIINGTNGHLEEGDTFKAGLKKLIAETFVEFNSGVILRVGAGFVNSLYECPDGTIAEAVVGFNTLTGAITVSFADTPQGKNAKDIVQEVLGPEAGGHAGIAGSPRGKRCTFAELKDVYKATRMVFWP